MKNKITLEDCNNANHINLMKKIKHNFTYGRQHNKIKSNLIIHIADSLSFADEWLSLEENEKYSEEVVFLVNWVNDNL